MSTYLPFFIVFCLSNVSHMDRHGYVHRLLILLDPLGLRKKTGSLVTNARPVLLCLFVPNIGVTLRVRQNDQRKGLGVPFGFSVCRSGRFFRSRCIGGKHQKKYRSKVFHWLFPIWLPPDYAAGNAIGSTLTTVSVLNM